RCIITSGVNDSDGIRRMVVGCSINVIIIGIEFGLDELEEV
ncbi:11973_t:CDS:1, partial [Diversispora eburnea]